MATDQTATAGDEPAFAALATFNADLFPAFGLRPAL